MRRLPGFDKLTYFLIFLFPIAGMLVKGWLTNVYNLLFLAGLFYLWQRRQPLRKEERIFLLICAVYVGIYILSGLVNGWKPIQTHDLGTEIRFWMVIPIYLLVREQPATSRWYLLGSLLAIVFIFVQSYYEVHWEGRTTSWGAYSKNLIGPFSALLAFYILYLWQTHSRLYLKAAIVFCFILALLATAMSGSRGGYVGFIAMSVAWLIFNVRGRWVLLTALVMAAVLGLVYQKSQIVNKGVNRALSSFTTYIETPDIAHSDITMDSTEIHLEMWRAAKYFFPDHPVLGVGPGNYQATARKYAEEGKVNPVIAQHGHPHNSFLEALYSKGIIGLICLLLLLYYPFYSMFRTRRVSHRSAGLGMLHIIGISAFSLFDASPILFNNYTSILLVGIAVFWSHHLNQINSGQAADA